MIDQPVSLIGDELGLLKRQAITMADAAGACPADT